MKPGCLLTVFLSANEELTLADSTDHRSFRATGNQRGPAGGLHAVQRDGRAIDAVSAAAFGNRENAFAQRTADLVTTPGDRLAVEVGLGEGFKDFASVSGGVAQANGVFHVVIPSTTRVDCSLDQFASFSQQWQRVLSEAGCV